MNTGGSSSGSSVVSSSIGASASSEVASSIGKVGATGATWVYLQGAK